MAYANLPKKFKKYSQGYQKSKIIFVSLDAQKTDKPVSTSRKNAIASDNHPLYSKIIQILTSIPLLGYIVLSINKLCTKTK